MKYVIALASMVFLLLLFLEIREPFFFLWDDNSNMLLPFYSFNYNALVQHGDIPLINFHQFCGVNHIGEGLAGVFYLPAYCGVFISKALFGSEFYAIDILAIIHLALSAIFFFLLMRRFSVSGSVSFICALVWITFPFVVFVPKSWLLVGLSLSYIPLCFLFLHRCIEEPGLLNALILALCRALFVYIGYFQYVHMQIIMEILFVVLSTWRKKSSLRIVGWYFMSLIGTTFLCAPQLLPSFHATRLSFWRSGGLDADYATAFALSVKDFLLAQLFMFREKVFCLASSQIYYTGVFIYPIFLFLSSRRLRNAIDIRNVIISAVLAAVSFLFSTSLYSLFVKVIPGLIYFKGQFKYFVFFQFFLILSLALTANAVIRSGGRTSRIVVFSLLVLTLAFNCFILFNQGNVTFGDCRVSPLSSEYLSAFSEKSSMKGRLLTCWMEGVPEQEHYRYLNWNYASLFNLYHFRGYPLPLISKLNVKYCLDIGNYEKPLTRESLVYLSFWGVRYFITTDSPAHRKEFEAFPQFKIKAAAPGILVCENTKALPLVWYKDRKDREIPFEMHINKITVHPDRPEGGEVVVSLLPVKGYRYYLDGREAGIVAEDRIPVIISLPAGVKELEIRYGDDSYTAGVIAFFYFLAVLAAYLAVKALLKHRHAAG